MIADAKLTIFTDSMIETSLDSPVSFESNSTSNSTNTSIASPSEIISNNFDNSENKFSIQLNNFDSMKSMEQNLSKVLSPTNGESNKGK